MVRTDVQRRPPARVINRAALRPQITSSSNSPVTSRSRGFAAIRSTHDGLTW
jgi:hypothetical protein